MRYLALDHGTKRIGVAISDELKMIAQPLEYIPTEPFSGFLVRLKQLLAEKEVERVFIGMPRNMDGTFGPAAEKVRACAGNLLAKLWAQQRLFMNHLSRSCTSAGGLVASTAVKVSRIL